jgi:hypothetical protein
MLSEKIDPSLGKAQESTTEDRPNVESSRPDYLSNDGISAEFCEDAPPWQSFALYLVNPLKDFHL